MRRSPTYFRAIVWTGCTLRCSYCHAEGDSQRGDEARGLPTHILTGCLKAAAAAGFRKFKLMGGEPLLRTDLPQIVAALRRCAPTADISVITNGTTSVEKMAALLEAGMDRANITIHGWTQQAFAARGGTAAMYQRRMAMLEYLAGSGRPVKVNYVYTGPSCHPDLAGLLDWAAGLSVVVGLLDDLNDVTAGPHTIHVVLNELRGKPASNKEHEDTHSLATTHLCFDDGLKVEVKTSHLRDLSPWKACTCCPRRSTCREGIYAMRLTHDGDLMPCMYRPSVLRAPLRRWVENDNVGAPAQLRAYLEEVAA